jgi:hypothetical protein
MKAITLWQPWATLLVTRVEECPWPGPCAIPMVKRIETRSWPCPPSIIGRQVAFHAAKRNPEEVQGLGIRTTIRYDGKPPQPWSYTFKGQPIDLPLGAIVGSGVITASLPIVDGLKCGDHAHVCTHPAGALILHRDLSLPGETEVILSDQLPYGDFTSGRWAWAIEDAAPTIERCPWCWGRGFTDGVSYPTDYGTGIEYDATPCVLCSDGIETGSGRCDPIPATGRQGFWEWDLR